MINRIKILLTLLIVMGLLSACAQRQNTNQQLWPRLQKSFKLNHHAYKPAVAEQIHWFQTHPTTLNRMLTNASPYMYYVYQQVNQKKLPGELVLLPVIESAYNPFAYSRSGAAGLWQLMPSTAANYGVKQNWWYDGRRDVYVSTEAAINHLTDLKNRFNQDWLFVFAAYNAGPSRLQGAINTNAQRGYSTKFWYLPLPHETQNYVPRLLALAEIIRRPAHYGITLPEIKDEPYFGIVNVGSPIALPHAAKLADVPLQELYHLNPGYNRWKPDPHGPYHLLLPIDKVEQFKINLTQPLLDRIVANKPSAPVNNLITAQDSSLPVNVTAPTNFTAPISAPANLNAVEDETTAITHIIKRGDTLSRISRLYHVAIADILSWNAMRSGQTLALGQKIVLQTSKIAPNIAPSPTDSYIQVTPKQYHVHKGDTLFSIARQFKTTIQALKRINNLSSSDLQLGKILKLP